MQTENNRIDLFRQLENNRYEIVITSQLGGLFVIKTEEYNDISMISVIDSISLYHYLNKKHKDLVPLIEDVLKQMEKSAEIQKITDELTKTFM